MRTIPWKDVKGTLSSTCSAAYTIDTAFIAEEWATVAAVANGPHIIVPEATK